MRYMLCDRQNLGKNAELRKLEFYQVLEQQKLKHQIEIAKLEERSSTEEERRLYVEERLHNPSDLIRSSEAFEFSYADINILNEARESECHIGSPGAVETKGFHFDQSKAEENDNPAGTNAINKLAKALVNLLRTPMVEVTKFTGDPRDYLRFVIRSRDQVLLQPFQES